MSRKQVLLLAQTAASIVMLTYLFRGLDLESFAALFRGLPLWFYVASLAVILTGQVLYAWRWRLVLVANGVNVSAGTVLRQYFISTFLNNFFPTTMGGDVAKVYYLGRDHGYRPVAASVFLDRLLGLGLLSVVAAGALWLAPIASRGAGGIRLLLLVIALAAAGAFALAVRGTGGLPRRVEPLGPRVVALASHLQRFRLDMAAAAAKPLVVGQAFGLVLSYFLALTLVYQTFIRLSGPSVPAFVALLAVATTTAVLSNVPVSLNGLGVREQLHVVLLQPLGVSREHAVAISLLLYAHLLVASLCGLVMWMRCPPVPADAGEQVLL